MAEKESLFKDTDIDRLMECMKEERLVEEAQTRATVARKKLVDAANNGVEGDEMELLIGECMAAAENETRVIVRSFQNRHWMRQMKAKIKEQNPDLHAKAEAMVGGGTIA